jgi:hypothetical protein
MQLTENVFLQLYLILGDGVWYGIGLKSFACFLIGPEFAEALLLNLKPVLAVLAGERDAGLAGLFVTHNLIIL